MGTVLVTGSAGFIGFHLCKKLLAQGYKVIGLDNLNDYYDPNLKSSRLKEINKLDKEQGKNLFKFYEIDLIDSSALEELFSSHNFDYIFHLAAQAGVRYSLEEPKVYIASNLLGFANILELVRMNKPKHFLFASSSSVYGLSETMPFKESHRTDSPVSLYAATKKSNEVMAHSYSHLFQIPTTGMRFFTVYGPFGRPDMAYFSFTKSINEGKKIYMYNHGQMRRDFTYIEDVISGIIRLADQPPTLANTNHFPDAPFQIFNIGNNKPEKLLDFIKIIEEYLGKKAIIESLGMQKGDVITTYANIEKLSEYIDFQPTTPLTKGLPEFIDWYKRFYN